MDQKIVDVDADPARVNKLLTSEGITLGGSEHSLADLMGDIETASEALDKYKSGSLSLSQQLSEAAEETEDETLNAILTDLSDGALGVYLRLERGDLEVYGERDGEYSGFLAK